MKPRHVLVVDDDADIRDVVSLRLSLQGCGVWSAKDCADALAIIKTSGMPEVILLDYCMPGMAPEDFMQELLKIKANPPRVIMMTAATEAFARARALGIPEVLTKPFGMDEILDRVEGVSC